MSSPETFPPAPSLDPVPNSPLQLGKSPLSSLQSPDIRLFWIILMVILLLGFGLRVLLIHYGLPLLLYEDEPIYYHHALGFGLGHWNIAYFKKPGFFLYSYALVYYLGFLYSYFMTWKDYYTAFLQDSTYVATLGRSLSVLFATGTILQMARLGRRAFGWSVGLAAAFFLAVDSTHLRISPIVISDIPSLFFVITSAIFAIDVLEKGRTKDYLLCAIAIALAASFKYNVFTVIFLISAHFLGRWPSLGTLSIASRWQRLCLDKRLWLGLFLIPVTFIVLNPMLLLDFDTFLNHLNVEQKHMLAQNPSSAKESIQMMSAFLPIFGKILPRTLGWPIYLMGFVAIPWAVWRYRPQGVVVFSFMLLFLAVILQFQLVNAKYLLPILAFCYLAAAVGLRDFAFSFVNSLFPFRRKDSSVNSSLNNTIEKPFSGKNFLNPPCKGQLVAIISFLLLVLVVSLPNIVDISRYLTVFTRSDTRQLAYKQIVASVHDGDALFLEPNTLTMDNQIIRRQLVLMRFERGEYRKINSQEGLSGLSRQTLETLQPRYVLIDYGMAEKQPDVNGHHVYKMPYSKAYYQYLQENFQLKSVIAPYTIFLTQSEMEKILSQKGFETLYATIQSHKTRRTLPGPAMLLLERR